jgi:hypothetical protein
VTGAVAHAIPTLYAGRQFRSRFEADTAARLDRDGFTWEYEEHSYRLGDGLHYRPDFLITKQPDGTPCRIWLECRGYVTTKGEAQLAEFIRQLPPGEALMLHRYGHEPQWFDAAGERRTVSQLLACTWVDARAAAEAAGVVAEFDRLTGEIDALRCRLASGRAPSGEIAAIYRLAQRRAKLVPASTPATT